MSISFLNISGWGIKATSTHHHGQSTVEFPTKAKDSISLQSLVSQSIPDKSHFYTSLTAFSGTLQTMALSNKAFDTGDKRNVHYGRRVFEFTDGGIASVDYVLPTPVTKEQKDKFATLTVENLKENWPRQNKGTRFLSTAEIAEKTKGDINDDSNVLIIIHGLGGGSHEPLIRDLITNVTKVSEEKLFQEIMVLNCRGCSRSKIATPELFCGFSTNDLREVIQELNELYPNRKIFLAGYSFGCVTILNYLAEESKRGLDHQIQLVFTIGGPWDMIDSNYRIQNTYSGKYLFEPAILGFLKRLVKNNRAELEPYTLEHPELGVKYDEPTLKSLKHISDFDDAFTAKVFGFNSSYEYYRKASPVNFINEITFPVVAINSIDDPCVGVNLPVREIKTNPYLLQVETDLGGHLAFIDSKGESWVNKKLASIFKTFINTVDTNKPVDNIGYQSKKNQFGV
ncbi:medium-chain fatty acid ethyl ester synthase/esterase [Saccharomycopsis crataegensis]|uniref:Medium-chain fatty acid ethyl ester synthase/esterase n=1 Tax=Saccharomycopsis crataegensis TaxID=43959 RepID=A0AAV5QFS2_9ASCO|nr:medium-chain fatty acid ethyl ester synthase/esterase [Saccharomycopsis crataegensis]